MDVKKFKELARKTRYMKGRPLTKNELSEIYKGLKIMSPLQTSNTYQEYGQKSIGDVLKGFKT